MGAPQGNKYALGNNGGRPPMFTDPSELLLKANEYFNTTDSQQWRITDLSLYLGFSTRYSFYGYKRKPEFKDVMDFLYNKISPKSLKPLLDYVDCKTQSEKNLKRMNHFPRYKVKNTFSSSLRQRLKSKNIKGTGAMRHVPYSVQELKNHLESLFTDDMSWDNMGEFWHIDHIKPDSMFSYTTVNCDGFKDSWALENLQPLSGKENLIKGNRYIG